MANPKTLRPASFRGIRFFVDTAETQGGRRNILHEYPYKDEPYTEDLGRKAREYTFDAYVIGEGHEDIRRRLLEAIEKNANPGTLIHPLFGSIRVIPGPVRHRYKNAESRIEYFSLTFYEAGENRFPDATLDTRLAVQAAADLVQTATKNAFVDHYTIREVPEFVLKDAQDNANEMVSVIEKSIEKVQLAQSRQPDFNTQLAEYKANIIDLASLPQTFADDTAALLTALGDVYSNPLNAFLTYQRLWEAADDTIPDWQATPSRKQMRQNREVQIGMINRLSVVGMAKAATRMEFDNYDEAVRFRQDLADLLEDELIRLGRTDYDNLFFALDDLRAQMIKDLTERSVNLDRLKDVYLASQQPAAVISYDLYGTSTRDQEIRSRNRVRHPLFMPAGQAIQVLVD
ncbi:DNA circularization protein [Vampirovibrio chlorellavorus]|uniref:DNA circularization protein n=1 Tax=Vampirovibrio chlorellavorus TaxID=758823 RepID=UPI0026EAA7AF|nr:DNA circularization N-terminal domain-containing protein [Vampirovibrio chlorellavorus]